MYQATELLQFHELSGVNLYLLYACAELQVVGATNSAGGSECPPVGHNLSYLEGVSPEYIEQFSQLSGGLPALSYLPPSLHGDPLPQQPQHPATVGVPADVPLSSYSPSHHYPPLMLDYATVAAANGYFAPSVLHNQYGITEPIASPPPVASLPQGDPHKNYTAGDVPAGNNYSGTDTQTALYTAASEVPAVSYSGEVEGQPASYPPSAELPQVSYSPAAVDVHSVPYIDNTVDVGADVAAAALDSAGQALLRVGAAVYQDYNKQVTTLTDVTPDAAVVLSPQPHHLDHNARRKQVLFSQKFFPCSGHENFAYKPVATFQISFLDISWEFTSKFFP